MLVLAVSMMVAQASTPTASEATVFYARVDYMLDATTRTSMLFSENEVKDLAAPPGPPGYSLQYMEIRFPGGMPNDLVPVKFDAKSEMDGKIASVVSYGGDIRLAALAPNMTVDVEIATRYIRSEWISLTGGELKFKVEEPTPPFNLLNLTVKVSIDNHAPYAVSDVIGPNGLSMIEGAPPDAMKVDPKHVELSFRFLDTGEYTIKLAKDDKYIFPSAFILTEGPFINATLGAGGSKQFTVNERVGWKPLGAVVIAYSVAPLSGRGQGGVSVKGELVDYAYLRDEVISISAASLLVPKINLKLWVAAYIVFGSWIQVTNNMKNAVNIMYAPIYIREAGEWTPDGVEITVRDTDLKDAAMAYVVVQAPSYGRIKGIVTPSGAEFTGFTEATIPWGEEYRSMIISGSEAYMQVRAFNVAETGRYRFKIAWQPITLRLLDANSKPIAGAAVEVTGPLNMTAMSDGSGVASFTLHKPGVYSIRVLFKGFEVARLQVGSFAMPSITVQCEVYRAAWVVTDIWDRPVEGAEVIITGPNGVLARGTTGSDGTVVFEQLPKGQFSLTVNYKRLSKTMPVTLDGNTFSKVGLDMVFELPGIGPISSLETGLIAASLGMGAAGLALIRRGRKSGEVEEEEILVEE